MRSMQSNSASKSSSIVILTFNHEDFIGECLERLLSITHTNLEIVVLDDGSTDRTLQVIDGFKDRFPALRVISQKNSGNIGKNTNKLLLHASGEFVTFLSGDDLLAKNFPLTSIIEGFDAKPDCVAVFASAKFLGSHVGKSVYSGRLERILRTGIPSKVIGHHLNRRVSRIYLQGTTIRRSFLELSGLPSTNLLDDDYDFIFRMFLAMARHNKTFGWLQDAYWEYRIHPGNIHTNGLRQLETTLRVIKRYVPNKHRALFRYDIPRVSSAKEFNRAREVIYENTSRQTRILLVFYIAIFYLLEIFQRKTAKAIQPLRESRE